MIPTVPSRLDCYGSPYVVSRGYMPRIKGDQWTWSKASRIVGSIECEQEAMPCVYISAIELDGNGQILTRYKETTRARCNVDITFQHNGEFWCATYSNCDLQQCVKVEAPTIKYTTLAIQDETRLLESLRDELSDWD